MLQKESRKSKESFINLVGQEISDKEEDKIMCLHFKC